MADVIIIGGGAAGLFCARTAAQRNLRVIVLEAQERLCRKVSICGGGYGNISNSDLSPRNYYSQNPHFVRSALKRFPSTRLLQILRNDGFEYEQRENCYFCTTQIKNWMDTVQVETEKMGVEFHFNTRATTIEHTEAGFIVNGTFSAKQLVLACGGRAYPQVGGTYDGLKLANALHLKSTPVSPGLAPIRFGKETKNQFAELQGIAMDSIAITAGKETFQGSLVFRPDGIGGIAVFKAASAWVFYGGGPITLNFLPSINIAEKLAESRQHHGTALIRNCVSQFLPRRLTQALLAPFDWAEKTVSQLKKEEQVALIRTITAYTFTPEGIGDYTEAEVMMGGIDTDEISSKTLGVKSIPNLYIAGEMMDVTGQLGGYNLHWAFATGTLIGETLQAGETL